jgi:hypothetical protein
MAESPDHAKVRAVIKKSIDTGIAAINAMAESYAAPYTEQISGKVQEDLWSAGYMIVPRAHVDALKKGK